MKLQILVPQYEETNEVIKGLLDSLVVQQNVDFNEFGVIIVNDGSNVLLDEDWLKTYPFQIEYYRAPHRGVSATRNTCLDYASADYVMFCDADDMFFNACGLWLIFREINTGFDTLSSKFIEESRYENGEATYIDHDNDGTFVHGKIHRRQYLIDNDIRWDPALTIHEDSYFIAQCQNLTDTPKYLNESFYLWRYRENSVCRKDPQYILKTLPCLLDSIDSLITKFIKTNKNDLAVYYTVYILLDIYYNVNKPQWKDKNSLEFLNKLELRAYEFFNKYQELWKQCSSDTIRELSQQLREKAIQDNMVLEDLTVNQWLNKLITNYSTKG